MIFIKLISLDFLNQITCIIFLAFIFSINYNSQASKSCDMTLPEFFGRISQKFFWNMMIEIGKGSLQIF